MLKLELTDGFGTVSALEYTPIPVLTTQLSPGTKLIINGPVRCINHILFLEAKNVRLLGGESPNLIIENAYENVLRKKLNQPINPNPKLDYQGDKSLYAAHAAHAFTTYRLSFLSITIIFCSFL